MNCNNTRSIILDTECQNNIKQSSYSFTGDQKCYQDGKYFGEIINISDDEIEVRCNNGNKYMEGQIVKFISKVI